MRYKRNTKKSNFRENSNPENTNYTAEDFKFANIKIAEAKSYSNDASILYKKRKINDAITKLKLSSETYKNIFYENTVLQKSASTLYDVISVYFALWALDTKNRQLHSKELLNQLEKFKLYDIDINKSRQEELFKDYEDVNKDIKFLKIIEYITDISFLLGLMSLLIGIFFPNIDFFAFLFTISCIIFLLSLLSGGAVRDSIKKACMKRIIQ